MGKAYKCTNCAFNKDTTCLWDLPAFQTKASKNCPSFMSDKHPRAMKKDELRTKPVVLITEYEYSELH